MTDETTATTPEPTTPTANVGGDYAWGTGRRKSSVARVRIRPGNGIVTVNGRPLDDYFPVLQRRVDVLAPLESAGVLSRFDVFANINGGGPTGQAGALLLGVARALVKAEPELSDVLREGGYLTRDGRMVERKKYGQRKARRRYQFSKR